MEQRTAIADYRTDKTEQGTEKQGQLRPGCPEEKKRMPDRAQKKPAAVMRPASITVSK